MKIGMGWTKIIDEKGMGWKTMGKAIKAEKMRKFILEEWSAKDPVQSTIQGDPLSIGHEGKVESNWAEGQACIYFYY